MGGRPGEGPAFLREGSRRWQRDRQRHSRFSASDDVTGSPGAGLALQGSPKLRLWAWVFISLHHPSLATGCPLG